MTDRAAIGGGGNFYALGALQNFLPAIVMVSLLLFLTGKFMGSQFV
jgi:hypothetical protein